MDREKVINGLRCIKGDLILCVDCAYSDENGHGTYSCKAFCANDAISMLKEQEEREKAICKEICDFIRSACSTDTDDDKDYVCYVIQNCFKHFCADGERRTEDG
ncbi:MAG: hypothetical protein K6F61_04090 [Clostridiales bacterium]|nr:hypothetical protein [Clostridiales bacterium]